MSVESCTEFLRVIGDDPGLRRQFRAMTGVAEMIRLGRVHGFAFDGGDLAAAAATDAAARLVPPAPRRAERPVPGFHHYEFALEEIPGFAPVLDELPHLKIRPDTVDLDAFDRDFRADDLRSTSAAPASAEFARWRTGAGAPAGPNDARHFHLVNLDDHVDHPAYDGYLAAKNRTVAALEKVFGDEVRFSGSMWYPPSSYRLWHTNESQPGWRMYLIDFDAPFDDPADTSFFRYQRPGTSELVTLPERPRLARFFRIGQEPERLFWHCIVNPTRRHRWSFGFVVPDSWTDALEARR
ncbi:Nif11 family protein [Actinomadura rayongensis]|uniref:Nif11 family protein n=1 Tax=Actinomadura rayongensis TaxID=1429076 RepID=A0A6I4W9U9_9ACTN|nr:Nif11 family protein [Actinomadura rayongensis]